MTISPNKQVDLRKMAVKQIKSVGYWWPITPENIIWWDTNIKMRLRPVLMVTEYTPVKSIPFRNSMHPMQTFGFYFKSRFCRLLWWNHEKSASYINTRSPKVASRLGPHFICRISGKKEVLCSRLIIYIIDFKLTNWVLRKKGSVVFETY